MLGDGDALCIGECSGMFMFCRCALASAVECLCFVAGSGWRLQVRLGVAAEQRGFGVRGGGGGYYHDDDDDDDDDGGGCCGGGGHGGV